MREHEIRSAVTPDVDPHLAAWREQEAQRTMRQRLIADGDVPVEYFQDWGAHEAERQKPDVNWRDCDTHVQALLARKGDASIIEPATLEHLRLEEDERVTAWRKNRTRARELVEVKRKMGMDISPELLAEADEPDNGPGVAALADAMRHRSKTTFVRVLSGQ